MQHINFRADLCVPNHKPWPGQYVWIDLTLERAEEIVAEVVKLAATQGRDYSEKDGKDMIERFFAHGTPPDLKVTPFSTKG